MHKSNLPSQNFQKLNKVHMGPIYSVKFNAAGQYAMTASQDRGVSLYNPSKNLMIKQYKNLHNYDVCGLAITNDNSKFITGGSDKVVIITDVAEGKSINKYSGHNGRINAIALNQTNNVIVSGSYDTTVRCWDNRSHSYTPIDIIKGFKDSVSEVEVRGFQIICGSMDGSVKFYDIRSGQFISDEVGQAVQSMSVAYSNRAYVVSGLNDTIYLIDKNSGNKIKQYKGHEIKNYTINCKFNIDDSHIISGSADGKLYIYSLMKSQPLKVIQVCSSALSAIDINQQGGLIAASHDGNVFYWKH